MPPSDVSQQSSDSETTGAKDENGQDIVCIVCTDKSSGKHYGQFTCEGKTQNRSSQLLVEYKTMPRLSKDKNYYMLGSWW